MLHPMKGSIVDKLLGYLAMCLAFVLTLDIVFIQLVNLFNYLLSLWLNPLLKHSNTGLINETSEMISVFAQNQDWRSSLNGFLWVHWLTAVKYTRQVSGLMESQLTQRIKKPTSLQSVVTSKKLKQNNKILIDIFLNY